MNPPDYKNYSIRELLEALDGVDSEEYPDRAEEIENELQYRKSAGYSIIASSPKEKFFSAHLSFYGIALPIWWACYWRFFVAASLATISSSFLFMLLIEVIPQTALIILGLVVNLLIIFFIGIFTTRQALTVRYRDFHIQIVPKTANKPIQSSADAPTD